jgi:tape measure domain-containing protein
MAMMLNSMQIASLYAKIGADTRPFDQALRGSDKALQSFGSRVGSVGGKVAKGIAVMGTAVAGTMAAMAAAVTTAGFKFNNLSQQGEIAFTTMLGSADKAKAFMADLQEFAARTPFEYASLMQASQKMLAMGFKENDVLPTLTAIGDAVAALGGGQEKIDRVTIALGQMQAKGKASAEEMMQLTEAGIPAWEMLATAIGVEIPEAMKMVTKGEISSQRTIEAIVTGMNARFSGMMEKQSKTFGGLWSTIMDTFQVTSGKVTKPLFDAVTRVFGRIVEYTNTPQFTAGVEKLTGWMGRLTEWAERSAATFSGRFMPVLRRVSSFAAAIPTAWRRFREIVDNVNDPGLHKTLNRLRAGFSGLGKVLKGLTRPFKEAFSGLFQSLMVARGSGWAGIFDVLITRLMTAVSKFGAALSNEAVPYVLERLKELGNAIKGWLASVDWWEKIKGWASAFGDWAGRIWAGEDGSGGVKAKLGAFWTALSSWFTDPAKRQALWDAVVKGWDVLSEWAGNIWEWAKPYLTAGWDWLSGWFTDGSKRQKLWDAVVKGWDILTGWAGDIWTWAKPKLEAGWTWLSGWFTDETKKQTLWNAVKDKWDAVTRWAESVWTWAKPKLDAAWTWLSSWVTDPGKRDALRAKIAMAWTGFQTWAGDLWDKVKPKLDAAWTSLSSWITDSEKRDAMRAKIAMAWTGFQNWAGKIWAGEDGNGGLKAKLNSMFSNLKTWIDTNYPNLGAWVDVFVKFAKDAGDQWAISFPNMQASFTQLRQTLEREAPLIVTALGNLWNALFGKGEGGEGGGFVRVLEGLTEAVSKTVGTIVTQFRILIDMMAVIIEGTRAIASGDFGAYWSLQPRFSDLMNEFKNVTGDQFEWFKNFMADRRAGGGRSTFGGMTWVGERGPELVNLPAGSHVYTNAQSTAMAAAAGRLDLYVHGESNLPNDRVKIRELAAMLQRELQLAGGRVLAV